MQATKRIRKRARRGFTLLEILIVIGIIALLAAFVVPNFIHTSDNAKKDLAKVAVSSGGTLGMQLDIYHTHMGKYPTSLKELVEKPDGEDAAKWAGPYIKDMNSLKDPWGEDLQYKFPGELHGEENYDLWSKGPDKQVGTDDDITNWPKG
jgi:general secretion pathway protein G